MSEREQQSVCAGRVEATGGWRVWISENVEDEQPRNQTVQVAVGGGVFSFQDYLTADEAQVLAETLLWGAERLRARLSEAVPA